MSEHMSIRPPDGQAAIGIDLGTSSSLVAVWTSVTGTVPEVRETRRIDFFF
jgi:molecular chaperone DnaK (HSP70)